MRIGMIGLGRMGANMVRRLVKGGHECVAYDRKPATVAALAAEGAQGANSLAELVRVLPAPRAVWIMVPAAIVDPVIGELRPLLTKGDVLIDGGNSNYRDDIRRADELKDAGIRYLDVGTSGGVLGLEQGFCLMIGGEPDAVALLEPALATLAPGGRMPAAARGGAASGAAPGRAASTAAAALGYLHCGPPGAGHFVKMIHNGIEYGLLQAYAEGYEILHASQDFALHLDKIAKLWNHGSVVRSWLNELAERAFSRDDQLTAIRGYVEDSGEGRWTVEEAMRLDVPAPVITLSLLARFRSRQEESFGAKVIAALRNEFGGHAVQTK